MSGLQHVHDYSGLPWWATIILSTVVLRTGITLPLAVYQQVILGRLEAGRREMKLLVPDIDAATLKLAKQKKWDGRTAKFHFRRQTKAAWKGIIERDNCHPAKSVVMVLGQLPLWLMLSMALRNMSTGRHVTEATTNTISQMSGEGLLWLPNLCLPDPFYVLPLTMVCVNLAAFEVASLQRAPGIKRGWISTYFVRGVTVLLLPVSCVMPTAVTLYWSTSSLLALSQNLLLSHPAVMGWARLADPHRVYRALKQHEASLTKRLTGSKVSLFDPPAKPKSLVDSAKDVKFKL